MIAPPNEEVHAWDTMQEKLSFSDRFGLTLTLNQLTRTYLKIVNQLAKIAPQPRRFRVPRLQWATRHNGRSGRTARQFIDFQAELTISRHTKSS